MTHHTDTFKILLGAVMFLCSVGLWFETYRGRRKRSGLFRSAAYMLWGMSAMLGGLKLGPIPDDISLALLATTAVLAPASAVLAKREAKLTQQQYPGQTVVSDSSAPQFQGYRTRPRI